MSYTSFWTILPALFGLIFLPSSDSFLPSSGHTVLKTRFREEQYFGRMTPSMASHSGEEKSKDFSDLHKETVTADGLEKLRSRLMKSGVKRFLFVSDHETSESSDIVHIKTLVWEAVRSSFDQHTTTPANSTGDKYIGSHQSELTDHYFVTVLEASDRVDEKALQHQVQEYSAISLQNGERLILRLADRDTAEKLTGFVSGTIPPIAHTFPMRIFIDQFLISEYFSSDKEENEPNGSATGAGWTGISIASVGSGQEGHDLHIPMNDMLRFAEKTSDVHVCSISRKSVAGESQDGTPSSKQTYDLSLLQAIIDQENCKVVGSNKPISKRIRDAAGKKGRSWEVQELIEEAGVDFPETMKVGTDGNFTKNALHLAAWKGDLESMSLLAEAGKSFDLDLINVISKGEGNYGKTPIFYSITQCRSDAVMLALSLGANLLIVNNKGQTPCSMAESHLDTDTCEALYAAEAMQLETGGTFINFRETHSDDKKYGDLDPRFPIDDINMGDDILEELNAHELTAGTANGTNNQPAIVAGSSLPRSIRTTSLTERQSRAASYRANASAKAKGIVNPHDQGAYTEAVDQGQKLRRRAKQLNMKKPVSVDIDSLSVLTLCEVFGRNEDVSSPCHIVVDNERGIEALTRAINESVKTISDKRKSFGELNDSEIAESSWGLDCEWKPIQLAGEDSPVATLQLSSATSAFLVDLQSICQSNTKAADTPLTKCEHLLSEALTKLLGSLDIAVVGFGVGQDIGKLAASFPHLPCFRKFQSVMDLHVIAHVVYSDRPKDYMSSLQKAVAILLGKRLDKSEQCSDWSRRPLVLSQIEYATLDAAVLHFLLIKMVEYLASNSDKYDGDFFQKHAHLRSSTRLKLLEPVNDGTPKAAYRIQMGSIKSILSLRMAKQTWPTGKHVPDDPEQIAIGDEPPRRERKERISTEKRTEPTITRSQQRKQQRKLSVKLRNIPGDYSSLPLPGTYLGYTKESCIKQIIGQQVMNSLAEGATLGYNRRGGVLEMSNSWLIFVNCGGHMKNWKYRNDFLEDGRQITFSVNPSKQEEGGLLRHFLAKDTVPEQEKKVFMFVRPSSNSQFLYCGECTCTKNIPNMNGDGNTNVWLEFSDYNTLVNCSVTDKKDSTPFRQLVLHHSQTAQREDSPQ